MIALPRVAGTANLLDLLPLDLAALLGVLVNLTLCLFMAHMLNTLRFSSPHRLRSFLDVAMLPPPVKAGELGLKQYDVNTTVWPCCTTMPVECGLMRFFWLRWCRSS